MKHINVAAAAIIKNGRVLCAQRSDRGETAKKWEFPGGKIEDGETPQQAAEREVYEELGVKIRIFQYIAKTEHQYDTFYLTMHVYAAELTCGTISLQEHLDSRWLTADELYSVDWAPADLPLMPLMEELLKNHSENRIYCT